VTARPAVGVLVNVPFAIATAALVAPPARAPATIARESTLSASALRPQSSSPVFTFIEELRRELGDR
jgi:hypothetical protein